LLLFRFGEGERDELLLLLLELDDDEDDDELLLDDDELDEEESESDPESEEEDEEEEEELLELLDEDEGLPRRRFFFEPFFCAQDSSGRFQARNPTNNRYFPPHGYLEYCTHYPPSRVVSKTFREHASLSLGRGGVTFGTFLVCHDGLGRAARERKLEPPQSGGSIGTGSRLRSVSPDIARGGRD
jgi:hypothetical protein